MEVEVNKIKPDKNQPRKTFDEEKLQFLAESILGNGLMKPIEVDENYIITDGERRWRAHKLAGLKKIRYEIVKLKGDKTKKLRRQMVMLLQDEDIETGDKYEKIIELWEDEGNPSKDEFIKSLGEAEVTFRRAHNYVIDKRKDPKAVEGFSAGAWREDRTLPKEER